MPLEAVTADVLALPHARAASVAAYAFLEAFRCFSMPPFTELAPVASARAGREEDKEEGLGLILAADADAAAALADVAALLPRTPPLLPLNENSEKVDADDD